MLRSTKVLGRVLPAHDLARRDEVLPAHVLVVFHKLQRQEKDEAERKREQQRAAKGTQRTGNVRNDDDIDGDKETCKPSAEVLLRTKTLRHRPAHALAVCNDAGHPRGDERHFERLQAGDEGHGERQRDEDGEHPPRHDAREHVEEEEPAGERREDIVEEDERHIDELIQRAPCRVAEEGDGEAGARAAAHAVVDAPPHRKDGEPVRKARQKIHDANADARADDGADVVRHQPAQRAERFVKVRLKGLQPLNVPREERPEEFAHEGAQFLRLRAAEDDAHSRGENDVGKAEKNNPDAQPIKERLEHAGEIVDGNVNCIAESHAYNSR